MRYRIPADPRRNAVRTRAMPRTIRSTSAVQSVCSVAHGPPLFRCAVGAQSGARSAALLSCNPFAMPRTIRCPMQPLKSYNRMQMQLASNPVLCEPPLAAMPQLSEKPHLGFATKKTAWKPAPNVCNFTVTLGLQVVVSENGVRKTYSARYYNPNTGRFVSRDPEDPDMGRPNDPKTLHKYLYAGGDPVNGLDPSGRGMLEVGSLDALIAEPAVPALTALTIHGAAWAATAVEVAAEITADLAIEAAEAAAGEFAAAADEIVTAAQELNALMRQAGVIGALTRAYACATGVLIAAQIVEHAFESPKISVLFHFGADLACYTVLDVRVIHH